MSKTKQKSKRKGSLKNIKKFKKNGPSEPSELRERSGIDVLKAQDEEDFYPELVIPSCTHGKNLLILLKLINFCRKMFAIQSTGFYESFKAKSLVWLRILKIP